MSDQTNNSPPIKPPIWQEWRTQQGHLSWVLSPEWLSEWIVYWSRSWDFVKVLELAGKFTLLIAAVSWVLEASDRERAREDAIKAKHYRAWELINSAKGSTGDGGRRGALQDLNADHVSLVGAPLAKAYLVNVKMSGADLSRADLSEAILSGADLSNAKLAWANLSGALLSGPTEFPTMSRDALGMTFPLVRVDLSGAILAQANLSKADLSYAILTNANLAKADLSGAVLFGVDLSGASLSGANLSQAKLDNAVLCGTLMPHGGVDNTGCASKASDSNTQ
jgi:hypothetical protein